MCILCQEICRMVFRSTIILSVHINPLSQILLPYVDNALNFFFFILKCLVVLYEYYSGFLFIVKSLLHGL